MKNITFCYLTDEFLLESEKCEEVNGTEYIHAGGFLKKFGRVTFKDFFRLLFWLSPPFPCGTHQSFTIQTGRRG